MARNRRFFMLLFACVAPLICLTSAVAQDLSKGDKTVDMHFNGDLHVGSDASAHDIGLPVYPGARAKQDEKDKSDNNANLSILTGAFGMKLLVMNFVSDDSPDKVLAFYRDKLKKYGKVIECHDSGSSDGPHVQVHENDKELRCEGDGKGNNIELKAGTEDNQHTVAVSPDKSGHGTSFALVYVHTRGKQADI